MFIFEEFTRPEVIRREKRIKQIILGAIVALIAGGFLYYEFKNYPEERVVKRFLAALERGNYPEAYRIWQPTSSYTYSDFLQDWGPSSEYGKVSSFGIVTSHATGSGVIVTASVNTRQTRIWVENASKRLAFPPF